MSAKILSVDDAVRAVRRAQEAGQSVVMCHGCFDIVHPGHVRHLQFAATQGQRLLVTITGDGAVDKGTGRPLIPQELRAENLAALDCVEWVTINTDATAVELLDRIRPDVYVKGAEYEHNRDPRFLAERAVVERIGGRVVFSSGDVVFSSTALIGAMEQSANPFHAALRRLIDGHDINRVGVDRLLQSFAGRRVLVAGETIRDTYVMCDRPDVAGESPVMSLRPIEYRSFDGGAAIIARHLAALGACPTLLTALPRSPDAEQLRLRLAVEGVDVAWIDLDQPMWEKQRFLVGTTKVMKLDLGRPLTVDAAGRRSFVAQAAELAAGCDAVIMADYGQGLFAPAMLDDLCRTVRACTPLLVGDVSGRRSGLLSLRELDILCPSESELRDAVHEYDDGLPAVVSRVLRATKSRAAIITLGAEGLITFEPDRTGRSHRLLSEHVPSFVGHAVDELGCGDALLAAATLALAAGGTLTVAAILGNIAAAVQAGRLGNAVINVADIRQGVAALETAQLVCKPTTPAVMAAG